MDTNRYQRSTNTTKKTNKNNYKYTHTRQPPRKETSTSTNPSNNYHHPRHDTHCHLIKNGWNLIIAGIIIIHHCCYKQTMYNIGSRAPSKLGKKNSLETPTQVIEAWGARRERATMRQKIIPSKQESFDFFRRILTQSSLAISSCGRWLWYPLLALLVFPIQGMLIDSQA